ncbi:DUF2809 domain-containing protein [Streptomyces sp. NBC_01500]|uniref:ribosomal maturation YjgA family protein n=1 Tax=Streptomyces sp. NBC_01500 TaxID=2903886 RepID=UPI00225806C1|nr:DUF2809 domain-containing protein [Streptomyces sp. NBC_01500]MCX4548297.1 DUF2809 domain-containing protein [Streptomyces sp. NBC_01500]
MSRRWWASGAAVLTVVAGLGVRAWSDGAFAKCAGDSLYTVLVYLVVVLLAPRLRAVTTAGIALAFSWAVEFLQIAGIPSVLRPLLGSTFHPPDLLWYTVGAALCWAVAAVAGHTAEGHREPEGPPGTAHGSGGRPGGLTGTGDPVH